MFRTPLAVWLVLVAALVTGSAMATTTAVPDWSLMPQPASLQPAASGDVTVGDGDSVVLEANGNARALDIARRFVKHVATMRGIHLRLRGANGHGRIVFHLDPKADIRSKAGYRIVVGDGRIRVTARTLRGLFYGSITTGQLLTPDAGKGVVRVADGRITDHPRYAWRGFMLDSARHFQSVAEIKQMIDWMALHKLDVLHWHLTDDQGWRLQIKRYPRLTDEASCRKAVGPDAALTGGPDKPYCGFYTQDQVRELVRYAAARFITIVPEIEMPGHAQAALHAYPELGVTGRQPPVSTKWGITPWLYAPDRRSLHFLENVLDEVMALFPSRYIHVGGDEAYKAQWEASPVVRAHLKKLGLKDMDALQGWMIDRIGAYLAAHGRTLVGWDEILSGGKLPQSAVVMSWHGVSGAVTAAEKGHDTILSPSPVLYLDHVLSNAHDEPPARPQVESLKDVYTFNPSPAELTPAQAGHIFGLQANLWTEYMPTFARDQHAVFPRMAAWAELAWSPASAIDWASFLQRMPAQIARYQALGIQYADSAWAPRFVLSGDHGKIRVALSNQSGQGRIRYTTDGSTPTMQSSVYTQALELPADKTTTLRAATFTNDGLRLATPRTHRIDAEALLTRNSDQLATCTHQAPLRIEDDRPLDGPRPVYKVDIMNTCWLWKDAPLDGVHAITLTIGNLPWNYELAGDIDGVVARPDASPHGDIEVHLDTCKGQRLARLPLAEAAKTKAQTTLAARLPVLHGRHTLCIFATGDPRKGVMWAIDTVKLFPSSP
ncbi:MAG TPA: family 20 glycosylhydrolase [Rhodanobacteraceae bacterium]|nr:family 20 glycosylhydrolase [Rhodanobacteraceae bacterium]